MNFLRNTYPFSNWRFLSAGVLLLCLSVILSSAITAQEEEEEEFTQEEFTQTTKAENDPIGFFNKGQDAHSEGDLEKALEFYTKALKSQPIFPEAEYQRGLVYSDLNQHSKAELSFKNAAKMRGDWSLPHLQLGLLYLKQQKFSKSETHLNKTIRIEPNSPLAYSALTELLLVLNADQKRLSTFLAKIRKQTSVSRTPAILVSQAAVERRLRLYDAAQKSISNALAFDRNNLDALAELCEIYIDQKKFDKAVETSGKILSIKPQSVTGKWLAARAHEGKGDRSQALAVLQSVEKPDERIAAFHKSLIVSETESIESLEKIIENDVQNARALGKLCSLMRVSNPQKALNYCKRALAIDKENINHAIGYGAALVQLKQYAPAVGLFRRLLSHSPENFTIHANLATALFQLNDFEAAKTEYIWITNRRPKLAIAYYFLAITHDRLQEYRDALVGYKKFLSLSDPESNGLEIEKVNLRLPILEGQIKRGQGKKSKRNAND